MLNLSYCSKVWVVSNCESFCFGNSLFNLKLHVSYWDIVAAIGDFSTGFVNRVFLLFFVCVCVDSLSPFPSPSLPKGNAIQEHVVLACFNTGWVKEQFIYLLILVFTCTFFFFVVANSHVAFVVWNCCWFFVLLPLWLNELIELNLNSTSFLIIKLFSSGSGGLCDSTVCECLSARELFCPLWPCFWTC